MIASPCHVQNLAEDWSLGSKGCYDAVSLARLQSTLQYDFRAVADGNSKACLSQPLRHDIGEHLLSETLKADPQALGKLMADHTQASRVAASMHQAASGVPQAAPGVHV